VLLVTDKLIKGVGRMKKGRNLRKKKIIKKR
jgi:hypothetical protein